MTERLRHIERKMPHKASGRHAFFASMVRIVLRRKEEGEERFQKSGAVLSRGLLAKHAVHWAAQSMRIQQGWGRVASQKASRAREELEKEVDVIYSQIGMLRDRDSEERQSGVPICLSAAGMGKATWSAFCD